jgi:hypothetical protein
MEFMIAYFGSKIQGRCPGALSPADQKLLLIDQFARGNAEIVLKGLGEAGMAFITKLVIDLAWLLATL